MIFFLFKLCLAMPILFRCAKGFESVKTYEIIWGDNTTSIDACSECYSPDYILSDTYECTTNPGKVAKSYVDVLPSNAKLLSSYVHIIGSFNCQPSKDLGQQTVKLAINDNYVSDSSMGLPNTGLCTCPNCGSRATFNISASFMEAHYFPTLLNTFRVVIPYYYLNSNPMCISKLIAEVHFSIPDPTVSYILPVTGPTTGGTNISVHGTNFSPQLPHYCVFSNQSLNKSLTHAWTLATYVSATEVTCSAPELLGFAETTIEVSVATYFYGDIFFTESSENAHYVPYDSIELHSLRPHRGVHTGDVPVTLTGDFVSVGIPRCLFRSAKAAHVVSGTRVGSGKIVCMTPAWEFPETVTISVSFNGQEFVGSLSYTFIEDKLMSASAQIAIISVAGVAVAIALVVLIIWSRHRRALDGYNKIDAGYAQISMKDIELGERIGRGTFGEVYKGTWRGAIVAVKKMRLDNVDENFAAEFESEVSLMRTLRAPNILQYLGSAFTPPDVCIVIEFMARGSLHDILHNPALELEWPLRLSILADAARGMLYLHTSRPPIIHRDLKSHNLLVDEFWRVKVCDFGLSTVIEQGSQTLTACGTPCWTAPEVLRREYYTTQADVYSYGIVMWECATRADPYAGMPPYKVICAVDRKGLRPKVPQWVPEPYVRLMRRCWHDDQNQRPDFAEVLSDIEEMGRLRWSGNPGPNANRTQNGNNNNKVISAPAKMVTDAVTITPPLSDTTSTTSQTSGSSSSSSSLVIGVNNVNSNNLNKRFNNNLNSNNNNNNNMYSNNVNGINDNNDDIASGTDGKPRVGMDYTSVDIMVSNDKPFSRSSDDDDDDNDIVDDDDDGGGGVNIDVEDDYENGSENNSNSSNFINALHNSHNSSNHSHHSDSMRQRLLNSGNDDD